MNTTIEGILSLINRLEDRFPGAYEFTSDIRIRLGELDKEMPDAVESTEMSKGRRRNVEELEEAGYPWGDPASSCEGGAGERIPISLDACHAPLKLSRELEEVKALTKTWATTRNIIGADLTELLAPIEALLETYSLELAVKKLEQRIRQDE